MRPKLPRKMRAGSHPLPKATNGSRERLIRTRCQRRRGPFEFSCGFTCHGRWSL